MNNKGLLNGLNKPIPERIREARQARGLTIAELANRVGVSRQAISQYELGHSGVSGSTMSNIADVLGFPLSFYFKPKNEANGASSALFFRSLKSATKISREMFSIRTEWIDEIYRYLDQFVEFPNSQVPNLSDFIPENGDCLSETLIDDIALHIRREWGLGVGPITDMILAVERRGFIVARNSLVEGKIDACSQWKSGRPYIFLGSDETTASRLRFDVAHELGHLILHSHLVPEDLASKSVMDRIEKEANRFASAFLLPNESFAQEIMSTSLDHFISLKRRWKVSIAAMLYRCSDLEILTENQVLYLRKQLSRIGRKQEPLDDVIPLEKPRLLRQAMELLLDKGVLSVHKIINDLSLPAAEVEALTNLEQGVLTLKGKVIPLIIKKRSE